MLDSLDRESLAEAGTRRWPRRLAAGLVLCLAGAIGTAGWYVGSGASTASSPAPLASGARPIPVEVAAARTGHAAELVEATGTLKASDSVVLRAEIPGRIQTLRFTQSSRVSAGAVLVELDAEGLRAELAQAEAALALSRENHLRAEQLSRRGSGTARALDEAVAQLRNDRARVDQARVRLDKATIRAPFAGILGLRDISPGHYVEAGDDLIRLDSDDPLNLDFRVSERYLTKVAAGTALQVRVDALPGESFASRVLALDPAVDVNGRAVRVRATVPNPDGRLRPGLFARVTLEVDPRDGAVLVPEAALVLQAKGPVVWRVADGKARIVPVRTGSRRNGLVEIVDGLPAGATVVVGGHLRLRDGAAVEVVGGGGPAPGS